MYKVDTHCKKQNITGLFQSLAIFSDKITK